MILGLSGYLKSGKDTAGEIIQRLTMVKNHEVMEDEFGRAMTDIKGNYVTYPDYPLFKIKKFAAKLKEIASLMTGFPVKMFEDQEFKDSYLPEEWNYEHKEFIEQGVHSTEIRRIKVREFLQKLGTDAVRNRLHKDAWVISAMADYKEGDNWIFTDCRFPNEAQAIKDKGGVIIRLNRYPPGCSPELMDRTESEVSLDDWKFDYVIYNLGTIEDLENQIKEIMRKIKEVKLVNT